ncbi:unnamed protein product [Pieris macdunnoughi]|uniref:Uncharacterized protein n=1 Tax=Pieris macdunnoughi TaxID=345717 RepID=A0A821W1J6_9NEOP|nr:unnamed protein product [Pieris macdunnoughi]
MSALRLSGPQGSSKKSLNNSTTLGYADAQARVEYMKTPSITATPMVQQCQFVIPAVIKPLLSPEPEVPHAPAVPEYQPYPMPPIIIKEDNSWQHLLYFMIFAMKNRNCAPPPMPYQYPMPGYDRFCNDALPYMPYPFPMQNQGMDTMYDDEPEQRDNEAVNCQMGCNCGPYPIIYREKSNDLDVILPILMLAMMDDGPFGPMPPMPLPYAGLKNNGGCGCGGYRC